MSYLEKDVPVVVVSNITETFFEFPNRAPDIGEGARLVYHAQCQGDRALLWLGDSKLVFVTFPVSHAEHQRRSLGYHGTGYAAPQNPSDSLCLDILREPPLIARLVGYAGAGRTVQIIPYATTPRFLRLVETLRTEHGLNVLLPESPAPSCMWLRDYLDTKAGFRLLVPRWLPDQARLLQGAVCREVRQAAEVVNWFGGRGLPCIVKADGGMGSIGHQLFRPGDVSSADEALGRLQSNPFLSGDLLVVEEFVQSSRRLSPSLEFFVPPPGKGSPEITYLCNQLFVDMGNSFLLDRELLDTRWYPPLAESGLLIANGLQQMGYAGHFDIDAVVDDEDRVFLLEVNARRTAGTHIHEFARFSFGPDYLDEVVLLGHGAMKSGAISSADELLEAIGDLLYPMGQARKGVVVTVTSTLTLGDFGCIIVARSGEEALALQQALMERVQNAGQPSERG